MRANANRAIRFVFDSVADSYASGRPACRSRRCSAARRRSACRPGPACSRSGPAPGKLTATLVEAGFEVVALEPGAELRRLAAARAPAANLRPETFEDFDPGVRFSAIFSSNAFHWLDPATFPLL